MSNYILSAIGNTPLIPIPYANFNNVPLYAKAEYYNPSGSVKDRAAKAIIENALAQGLLENKTLIDATSGNTGLAYACIAASLGMQIELALPENASIERKKMLGVYGAKVHYTDKFEGTDGAQRFVQKKIEESPHLYYYPDQYNNDANWQAHYAGTGPEIWQQTKQQVSHFCAGVGTTGTFIGTSRFLKKKEVRCIQIQPDNPMHGLEGWKHLDTALVPGIYDSSVADEHIEVSTENAFSYAIACSRYLGLLLSPSAAANIYSALKIAKSIKKGCVVTIIADNGMKYLNDKFWSNNDYFIENPFN